MIETMEDDSTGEPVEILAATSDLVPTGSGKSAESAAVDWQTAMKRAIRCSQQLRRALGLREQPKATAVAAFPTFVPLEFVRRMRRGDENDPLLRQVLTTAAERLPQAGFADDPVGDLDALAAPGLLHKYCGRALVISTGACGIHCRYCFRREFPYQQAGSRQQSWRPAISYLAAHPEIDEVILSGGDPLTLVDDQLRNLTESIQSIDHVKRLRIHTRMPIVIPQRVTDEFVEHLAGLRMTAWVVVHINHPRELDASVVERLAKMIDAGIPVLNQAVLLRGVNDQAATLIELCRQLVNHRIQPYYLHQLDRVFGASHFEVPVARGLELMQQIRHALPGYAVPRYVIEQPGERSKTPAASAQSSAPTTGGSTTGTPASGNHVRP